MAEVIGSSLISELTESGDIKIYRVVTKKSESECLTRDGIGRIIDNIRIRTGNRSLVVPLEAIRKGYLKAAEAEDRLSGLREWISSYDTTTETMRVMGLIDD